MIHDLKRQGLPISAIARRVIEDWITFYNIRRPHSALEHRTPAEAYWDGKLETQAA